MHTEAVQTPKGGEAVTFVGHVNLIAAASGWPLTNYYHLLKPCYFYQSIENELGKPELTKKSLQINDWTRIGIMLVFSLLALLEYQQIPISN